MIRTKEDIEYHRLGYGYDRVPAVNVKVYKSVSEGFREWDSDYAPYDPRFTRDWIEENISDELAEGIFNSVCEMGWEDLTERARDIYGHHQYTDRYGARKYSINVYSEGRSGGWAYIDGINTDVDSWDAIEFTQWKRFAKYARDIADGVMWGVVDTIFINHFQAWKDEQSELFAPDMEAAHSE